MNPLSKNYLTNLCFNHISLRDVSNNGKKNSENFNNNIQKRENRVQKEEQLCKRVITCFVHQNKHFQTFLQYTNEGYLFAFTKTDNILSGRSIIIFPDGIMANCNVLNHRLSGWNIICKKNVFYNISKYQKGRFQGIQYTYDVNLGLTVQSLYKNGKIQSIKHGFADNQISFEKYINNRELIKLLHDTLNYQYFKDNYPIMQQQLGNFYGEIYNSMPRGLGVLITQSEYFYGQFVNGLLSGFGTMLFQNGDHYIGQFQQGIIKRYGTQTTKGSTSYKYNNQTLKKMDELQYKQITSYQETQLSKIFSPMVQFYLKLKEIYAKKLKTSTFNQKNQDASFVQINLSNIAEEPQERGDSQNLSLKSPHNKETQNEIQANRQLFVSKYQNFQLSKPNSHIVKPTSQIVQNGYQSKQDGKSNIRTSKIKSQKSNKNPLPKAKKIIINDKEWNEVIQQLQDNQSINRQNGFLPPKNENVTKNQEKQSVDFKKNPMNSRLNLQYIKIQQIKSQEQSMLQNRMIKKLVKNQ